MMLREIKLRAWVKQLQTIEEVVCLNLGTMTDIIVTDSRTKDLKYTMCCQVKDVELMQYTGLKDKNSVEIYESDLLRVRLNDECSKTFEVFFDNGKFQAKGSSCNVKEIGAVYDLAMVAHESEVIGNIYETHELLKGDKE